MGELQTEPFQFTFNGFLKVAFQGSRITSDAGLILVRELDERQMALRGSSPRTCTTLATDGTRSSGCPISCGSRCTAAWRATKTSTTRSVSRPIRPFV